jgi:hypothetical protein
VDWFDGNNWDVYNTSNSDLPDNGILSIAIDGSGNIWIGTGSGGLASFDGTNWEVYSISNPGSPDNTVQSIAIDSSGNIWIGTWKHGLARIEGTIWTFYTISNSELPDNDIQSIVIDDSDNKWIGTYRGGLAVYNEVGVVSIDENNTARKTIPKNYRLRQNYPNPFNPSTTIEFSLPKSENVELKVYNILGKEVSTLVSKKLNQGNHTYQFDSNNLASGIYYYQLVAGQYREVKKMILLR